MYREQAFQPSRGALLDQPLVQHKGLRTEGRRGYNSAVSSSLPIKSAARNEEQDDRHQHHHAIYAAEATGLLLMAVLLLILTVIRYWRDIPWSAR